MSSFSKQHLIFMPENGKGQLKFTTDLKIQAKHECQSCEMCQARVKNYVVNVGANNIQNQILVKQRQCSQLWMETLDQLSKGNVSSVEKDPGDIICIEESDIEEIATPPCLPILSPIINVPTITPPRQNAMSSGNQFTNMNQSVSTTTARFTLNISGSEIDLTKKSPKQFIPPLQRTLSAATIKTLIYSNLSQSSDHVFWVDRTDPNAEKERSELRELKTKVKKAYHENMNLAKTLECEIKRKETSFANKYIKKIEIIPNLPTQKPMKEREAIYDPLKTKEMFNVKPHPMQKETLQKLYQDKCDLLALQKMNNVYVKLVQNELYYRENMYRDMYLNLKKNKQMIRQNINEKRGKKKLKRLLKRKNLSQRNKDERKQNENLGEFCQLNTSTMSEPIMNDNSCPSTPIQNTSTPIVNSNQTFPSCLSARQKRLQARSLYKNVGENTPTRSHNATKFRPYRSLLRFPSPDS